VIKYVELFRCLTRSIVPVLLLVFPGVFPASAQFSLGVTIGGIAVHQGKSENNRYYQWKIDRDGTAVFFAGITLSASYRINDYLGIKLVQSFIGHDSAGKQAGISHIGIELHDDLVGMKCSKHQFSQSIGPFWYYRKGWKSLPDYRNDPEFLKVIGDGSWERLFVWYGGFFNYRLALKNWQDLSFDFLPGYPHIYAISGGVAKNQ